MLVRLLLIFLVVFSFGPVASQEIKTVYEKWLTTQIEQQILSTEKIDSIELFGLPIKDIPDELFDYPKLRYLRIDCSSFECMQTLTSRINELKHLEILIITKSALRTLPKEIGLLSNLKVLSIMGGGRLASIPNEIGQLQKLEILDLWRNSLEVLPLGEMKGIKLKKIFIGGNNLKSSYLDEIRRQLPQTDILEWR